MHMKTLFSNLLLYLKLDDYLCRLSFIWLSETYGALLIRITQICNWSISPKNLSSSIGVITHHFWSDNALKCITVDWIGFWAIWMASHYSHKCTIKWFNFCTISLKNRPNISLCIIGRWKISKHTANVDKEITYHLAMEKGEFPFKIGEKKMCNPSAKNIRQIFQHYSHNKAPLQ